LTVDAKRFHGTLKKIQEREGGKTMTSVRLLKDNGFTLVEILVAIGILAIAFLGLISVTVMTMKGNTFSKTLTTAATLANDKTEDLKRAGYAGLASGSDMTASLYARTWTIAQNSPAAGMKTVSVTVQWSWQGANRSVTVSDIIAQ
jgi:prepilin-type N-terminal cleavage/methylation domain-containing protein